MKRLLPILATFVCWSTAPSAEAAKPLASATAELMGGPIQIRIGRALEKLPEGRVRFTFTETLYGTETGGADVLVKDETYRRIEEGHSYLVAYSRFRKSPLLRDVIEPDPRGPVAVSVTLAGELVLADHAAARRLILGPLGKGGSARAQAKAVFELLEGDDVGALRFATMELYGRDALRNAVRGPLVKRWARLLHADAVDPLAQEFLFRAADRLPGRPPWVRDGARNVLAAFELPLDPVSPLPSLAITAMDVLAKTGAPPDARSLEHFVRSRNPGVAKGAIRSMDHLDRAYTLRRATEWLADLDLLDETRRSLRAYLARHEE